ncbi:CRISPR-associated protein [Meiothermus luteus]|jgi:CRISPR-associated DxTHG motif protein|uniref:CRISPR-associated protein n=1 Tax=Meiothermus luteus TaxID=2026184 RepID=A0A399EZ91_9DEIN|nr:TIGR02221 family CRISPR-associated protein [Meiothermus luteus]RIH89338.1 CRISPR-associated protein [Meiothermus luteus]
MKVVVSILGLGRWDKDERKYIYEETQYGWGDKDQVKTTLIQEAFAKWFPDAKFLLLATEKAQQERSDGIRNVLSGRDQELVSIPDGKSADEFWDIYNALTNNLQPDSEVILDITHGFRSLGMLAFLAIIFLQAAKRVKLLHVLYGAQEAKGADGTTPIFDLTPFVTMLDWASATNRFLETGYPQKLAELARLDSSYGTFFQPLSNFSLSMQLHDPVRAGNEAKNAIEALEALRLRLNGPMEILGDQIVNQLTPLAFTKGDPDKKQLQAIYAQIDWYIQHQHYEKAVGLAKEWIYLFARWKSNMKIWPDSVECKFSLNSFLKQQENEPLKISYDQLKSLRDQMMHWRGFPSEEGEFTPDNSSFETVTAKVRDALKQLSTTVAQMGLELPEVL